MSQDLTYILRLNDQMSAALRKIGTNTDQTTGSITRLQTRVGTLKSKLTDASDIVPQFSSEIGGLGNVVKGISNPFVLASAAIAGTVLAMRKGIEEASLFELEFRKLQNINLDKTKAEVDDLRNRMLGISYANGFDPNKFSQGVFDIQSLTGDSGRMSEAIVKAQYKFAKASGADANKYISGSGIAMKNYGFGAEQIDAYNRSNMGLVATAKITYDQLAEVSSMYAGPAAAANQSFDSANKLMAAFTARTKSADEAATLTKQTFTDLFKKSTVDSFKSIGIDLYDIKGNAKQVDQIILELNKKFGEKTSAKAMDELRNKFQGSEGINALLGVAKLKTDVLLDNFSKFDKGGDGLQKMLASAKDDINNINDEVNGKLKSAWVSFGESVLPIWVDIKKGVVDVLDAMNLVKNIDGGDLIKITSGITSPTQYFEKQTELRAKYAEKMHGSNNMSFGPGARGILRDEALGLQSQSKSLMDWYNTNPFQNKIAPPKLPGSGDTPTEAGNSNASKIANNITSGGTRNTAIHINFKNMVESIVFDGNLADKRGDLEKEITSVLARVLGMAQATS